ncbi:MAG: hypothetical protein FJW86_13950 [Actinobacteria bacterium]|nr:hypothetical protein [Actinomycetota bacterium]
MAVESRDSISLKPAELDELGQFVSSVGLPLTEQQLDQHVEQFPLVAIVTTKDELAGILFGSLERIGGTPCILWGLGAIKKGQTARATLESLVGELYRRAAISFPDEDVLVAGRIAFPSAYSLFGVLSDVCPRPKYTPNGEERAWGRRLARRFGCDARYDDRTFKLKKAKLSEPVLDSRHVKLGGKAAVDLVGVLEPTKGEALIAYGWAMAEQLADGLAGPKGK